MPELPEVETTLRGIAPHITAQPIKDIIIRNHQLRWPIPSSLPKVLSSHQFVDIRRRAKYLLFYADHGTMILHLGMSGHLRLIEPKQRAGKHDHVDIVFANTTLRYNDPRRFGSIHWTTQSTEEHKLLKHLGPEPLSSCFSGEHLYQESRNKHVNIKSFIMNSKVVVGVGNIYASESLFYSGIHPKRPANKISLARYCELAHHIKHVLSRAITAGGTTLKDFSSADGKPGYFTQSLKVYGRDNESCEHCGKPIRKITQNQRSTFYCPKCQT